jgi:hypothetical protein
MENEGQEREQEKKQEHVTLDIHSVRHRIVMEITRPNKMKKEESDNG